MKFKNKISAIVLSSLFVISSASSVSAMNFNDVPSSHWAYSSVNSVSDKGLMYGDISGNFNLESYIDKFETCQILARLLGYNETNPTDIEKKYYEDAYEKNKTVLLLYKNSFSKWDSSVNSEIAFLIEKGVLDESDLAQFVIKREDGSEVLRALSREENAEFLVKALGEESQALNYKYTTLFKDDANITSDRKPYVYYLKSTGIVNGDTDNNFTPKNGINKAAMAVMVNKTYTRLYGDTSNNGNISTGGDTTTQVSTVVGEISEVYTSLNTIVINVNGTKKHYLIDTSSTITVDDKLVLIESLKSGMTINAVAVNDRNLVTIKAATSSSGNTGTIDTTGEKTYEGTVSKIYNSSTSGRSIDIESSTGTVTNYSVSSDAKVTRNGSNLAFLSITQDDTIVAKSLNGVVYEITLTSRYLDVDGKILEKGYDSTKAMSYYVIEEDDTETEYTVYSDSNSRIYRDSSSVSWNEVKIGDEVTVSLDLNIIERLDAYSVDDEFEGYVKEIYISETSAYLVLEQRKNSKNVEKFVISPKTPKLYSLQVGSLIELELDSSEVESIDIIESAKAETIYGTLEDIYRDRMVITENSTYSSITIYYDTNTKFINSKTGATMSPDEVDEDATVYVTYTSVDSEYASVVTVVQ